MRVTEAKERKAHKASTHQQHLYWPEMPWTRPCAAVASLGGMVGGMVDGRRWAILQFEWWLKRQEELSFFHKISQSSIELNWNHNSDNPWESYDIILASDAWASGLLLVAHWCWRCLVHNVMLISLQHGYASLDKCRNWHSSAGFSDLLQSPCKFLSLQLKTSFFLKVPKKEIWKHGLHHDHFFQ